MFSELNWWGQSSVSWHLTHPSYSAQHCSESVKFLSYQIWSWARLASRFFSKTIIFSLEKIQTMFINPFFPGEWHQIFHWFRMCLSWGNFSIHTLFHFWNPYEEQVPRNPPLKRDFAVTREISKRGPTSSFFQTMACFTFTRFVFKSDRKCNISQEGICLERLSLGIENTLLGWTSNTERAALELKMRGPCWPHKLALLVLQKQSTDLSP